MNIEQQEVLVDTLDHCWRQIKNEVPVRLQKNLATKIFNAFREAKLFEDIEQEIFMNLSLVKDAKI